ncbi:acetyltransferase [Clostridium botulinum B2 128]|uniref:GNAT family N-acetyltransferase n=1 Tax=Clostridium botulinum TaxID=1491 RepID=UPI000581CEFC|nr:GNAT family N-acetyltransferase [Clostridium botulinum]KEI75227.1 acetyltransferase [Clostridium botulinum B2 128]NFI43186.1 GNAT family N-acetyltransferase [Clostridium botulinum]NFI76580.1 GNAT family N-acetyltransferase [Clostridium botulinum]NFI84853.1 GNAT family N-acetyltransferase [Clostridium botulinum]NFJ37263.1 GNAT family N-acetyltransferase [Clostridium botulinum]
MNFKEITISDIKEIADMYVTTFNSSPWNDEWTIETSSKRLYQMINCESSYGLVAYEDKLICGMILGSEEQYYNSVMFNIKEFCVRNDVRSKGFGTKIFEEFENRLKNRGITEIILLTSRDDRTEGFYKKKGLRSYNEMVFMGKQI